MPAHFEQYRDKSGHYCFRIKAGNGELVMDSKAYSSADSRDRAMDWVVGQFAAPACERIAELIATLKARDARIAKLEAALRLWDAMMKNEAYDMGEMVEEFDRIARATLGEKK